jgi:hypothetical protein
MYLSNIESVAKLYKGFRYVLDIFIIFTRNHVSQSLGEKGHVLTNRFLITCHLVFEWMKEGY